MKDRTSRIDESRTEPREAWEEPGDESRAEPSRMEDGTSRINESTMKARDWRAEFRDEWRAEPPDTTNRLAINPGRNLESTALGEPEIGALEGPKSTFGGSKIVVRAPWGSRSFPELSQNGPRPLQERPKNAQERPRAPQERPKSHPRGPKRAPRGLPKRPGELS